MAATKYEFKMLSKGSMNVWDERVAREVQKWGQVKLTRKGKDSSDFTLAFLNPKD